MLAAKQICFACIFTYSINIVTGLLQMKVTYYFHSLLYDLDLVQFL